VEELCCDTGEVLHTHASVAAAAQAHDVDAKVVYNALGMLRGGRVDGVVLRWPKFESDQYGPYAELTLADVFTVKGESAPEARPRCALSRRRLALCETACLWRGVCAGLTCPGAASDQARLWQVMRAGKRGSSATYTKSPSMAGSAGPPPQAAATSCHSL